MTPLDWFLLICGVVLQILSIQALLRRGLREFPFCFTYLVSALLLTVLAISAETGVSSKSLYARYYYYTETCAELILLAIVTRLFIRSTKPGFSAKWKITLLSIAGAGVCLVISHSPSFGRWMTLFSRDLYFFVAGLNFVVWTKLIANPKRDADVLGVSGGLGIQMAGAAVGHSLRILSHALIPVGNFFIVASNIAMLFVWWKTFRHLGATQAEPEATLPE